MTLKSTDNYNRGADCAKGGFTRASSRPIWLQGLDDNKKKIYNVYRFIGDGAAIDFPKYIKIII